MDPSEWIQILIDHEYRESRVVQFLSPIEFLLSRTMYIFILWGCTVSTI